LESEHSVVNKYCPKRQHFSFKGMVARTELAALDHNANLDRQQAVTATGEERSNVVFPKRTQNWVAKRIMQPKKHSWRLGVAETAMRIKCGEVDAVEIAVPDYVPENIAKVPKPPKEEAIQQHRSRFV
jgi:hypothetical protein